MAPDVQFLRLTIISFHLVRNRDVLARLQREISVIAREGDVTREQIQKLPFLRCCLNESLCSSFPTGFTHVDQFSFATVPNVADEPPLYE
jgi:hypothetical protein